MLFLFVFNSIPPSSPDLLCVVGRSILQAAFLGSKVNWLPVRFGQQRSQKNNEVREGETRYMSPFSLLWYGTPAELCLLSRSCFTPQACHDSAFNEVALAPGLWLHHLFPLSQWKDSGFLLLLTSSSPQASQLPCVILCIKFPLL